ncbi:hypothetical protein NOU13_27140 [Rhodococcus erythropolis]|uniref:hypothetical protein n=1 Tax=Rhodococcus erythropolis TaxID=1833 RepID=UPI00210ABFFA|nr:hypothetical protein [Rhodococcus erythropolis]MCQ4128184.1 hypothetical protein [Rhodococcus erythropolis]
MTEGSESAEAMTQDNEVERVLLRAVVLDTNAIHSGHFAAGAVRGLAERLQDHRVELWIPQQVVWEWSSHAMETVTAVKPLLKKLSKSEMPGAPAKFELPTSSTDIVDLFTTQLDAMSNVVVVPTDGTSAIAAIRDQVLGTGAGAKRAGVRTGCVDSVLTRDAVAFAGSGSASDLVFFSANKADIEATLDHMGLADDGRRIVASEKELFADVLSVLQPASADVRRIIQRHILEEERSLRSEQDVAFESWVTDLVSGIDISSIAVEPDRHGRSHGMDDITSIDPHPYSNLVAISDVEVDGVVQDTGTLYVSFVLTLESTLTMTGYSIDNDGSIEMDDDSFPAILTVPCVALVRAGEVADLRQAGRAVASEPATEFFDADDAFWWFIDLVASLTDTSVDGDIVGGPVPDSLKLVDGSGAVKETVSIEKAPFYDGDGSIEWEASFETSGASIRCVHDLSAHVWAGADSFDVYPPYSLVRAPYYVASSIWRKLNSEEG